MQDLNRPTRLLMAGVVVVVVVAAIRRFDSNRGRASDTLFREHVCAVVVGAIGMLLLSEVQHV